jgi:hypothetical protein
LAIALGVALFLLLPRWVKSEVVLRARALGVELLPGEVDFGLGWVQLSDSRVALSGVRGLSAKVGVIDVALAGMEPKRIALSQADVTGSGDLPLLAAQLEVWRAAHERDLKVPLTVKPFSLRVQQDPNSEPELLLEQGELAFDDGTLRAQANRVQFLGRALGAARGVAGKDRRQLALTLGESSLDNPVLAVEQALAPAPKVHVALNPIALGKLAAALKLRLPLPEVVVNGSVDSALPSSAAPLARVSGRTDITLKGYVPPHPVELDGFVFGDTTTISALFALEPELLRLSLDDVTVKAGRFALKGQGELRLVGAQPRLVLALTGSLPCAALAGAAAETRLGRSLGKLTGNAARITLEGAVGVRVTVDANLDDPDGARVLKTISPGCGLKPLTLVELRALGELLPQALDPNLAKDFEKLLKAPPTLPNLGPDVILDLPPLPQLPALSDRKKPGSAKLAPSSSAKASSAKPSAPGAPEKN